jgi:DNA-binding transcriptional regulator YdaS (Cro superfamily)
MTAIDRAISSAGTAAELARRLGVLPQHINNWRKRGVPAERCVAIECATEGVVTRHELRPDVFGPATNDPEAGNG